MIGRALLAPLLLMFAAAAPAQPRDAARWLADRAVPIPEDGGALPRLPVGLAKGRLILLGEVHGLAHGQVADLSLLRTLHRQAGVRNYLGEFDAAQADAFNHYLETGNPQRMDAVFAAWQARGLQWASSDFRQKLVSMGAWNQRLPASARIRFFGADEIQDRPAFCIWLAGRLVKSGASPALANLADALRDPARCDGSELLARAAIPETRALDPVTADAVEALAIEAEHRTRDERIEANARRHLAGQKGRFYGLWGISHVVQAEVNGSAPLALRLARSGVEVRSMAILNLGGQMMIPRQGEDGHIDYGTMPYTVDSAEAALVNGIEPFSAVARGALTLFPLDGPRTPYRGSDALTRVGGRMGEMQPFRIDPATAPKGLWTDGVIISRNSPPVAVYRPEKAQEENGGNGSSPGARQ